MRMIPRILPVMILLAATVSLSAADDSGDRRATAAEKQSLPEDYSCMTCHRKDGDLYNPNTPIVTAEDLTDDIHWQRGLRCHDCHGSSPTLDDYVDHRDDPTFRAAASPADVPGFCGHCHSDIEYMRRYDPSARTDQVMEYWTSGHGKRLKATAEDENTEVDDKVATCIDCHGNHGILAVDDQRSPVYATRVAETCAKCHADEKLMAGRTYRDRALGHDQHENWRQSVHGQALMDKGDLSAPTCNDCHGNHGAMPPGVDSVANACGTCHGKVSKLFAETRMKHRFEEEGLPGCATCHGNHQTIHPTDDMLGMSESAVCLGCHNPEKEQHGASVAGAETAKAMRAMLDELKVQIAEGEKKVEEAERLGMEVRGPRFDLRQADDALTNARSLVHSFAREPFEEAVGEGTRVVSEVKERAEAALEEHTQRRVWLAGSLIPILLVVGLLLAYIRTMPLPEK